MRRIEIQEPKSRAWSDWRNKCKNETEKLQELAMNGGEIEINASVYGNRKIKKNYFVCGNAPFYGKCAYCEVSILDTQHGDIEHFRPKKAVTDAQDQCVYLKDLQDNHLTDSQGNCIPHPGYYWLAYDWQNLLPSCEICNQGTSTRDGRKIGKHSRFPVIGRHAQNPDEIEQEQPLLINPTSNRSEDDPSKHLKFNTTTFRIEPINNSKRGRACIDIFGLNIRSSLIDGRKRACREVKVLLVTLITSNFQDEEAKADLEDIKVGKSPFSLSAQTCLEELGRNFHKLTTSIEP